MRRSEIVHMKKLNACKFPSHFQFVVSYLASKDSPSPLRDLPRPVSTSRTHLLFHCHDSRSESLLKLSGMLSCHSDHLMIQQSSPPKKASRHSMVFPYDALNASKGWHGIGPV